jgi:hypothetical protein
MWKKTAEWLFNRAFANATARIQINGSKWESRKAKLQNTKLHKFGLVRSKLFVRAVCRWSFLNESPKRTIVKCPADDDGLVSARLDKYWSFKPECKCHALNVVTSISNRNCWLSRAPDNDYALFAKKITIHNQNRFRLWADFRCLLAQSKRVSDCYDEWLNFIYFSFRWKLRNVVVWNFMQCLHFIFISQKLRKNGGSWD